MSINLKLNFIKKENKYMNKFSQKDIGAILYMYYIDNYCENMFSFDNGTTLSKVKSYYNKLVEKYGLEEIEDIEEKIDIRDEEGTDYDAMYFSYENVDVILQVTSMINYDGNSPEGYSDSDEWCDVGMFLIDYRDVNFDDLSTAV